MAEAYKVEISRITKVFKSKDGQTIHALGPVDLSVPAERFVSIIGPSGCGKSTLLNIIAGLVEPTDGTLYVDGRPADERVGRVAYMLQKDLLLPWRTILDNIILGLEFRGVPRHEAVRRALPLMARYGLHGFERFYPAQLSGGMRQRAAFLRTLLYDSEIILLDEPFGSLDAQTRSVMQDWLLEVWWENRKTIIAVTHDVDEAIYLSDEVYVMSPRPGIIKARVIIDLPRPRSREVTMSARFVELKRILWNALFGGG
jgi:ABC-type nitrate/sulfonate/bicarbonate transport system ATPase subunit